MKDYQIRARISRSPKIGEAGRRGQPVYNQRFIIESQTVRTNPCQLSKVRCKVQVANVSCLICEYEVEFLVATVEPGLYYHPLGTRRRLNRCFSRVLGSTTVFITKGFTQKITLRDARVLRTGNAAAKAGAAGGGVRRLVPYFSATITRCEKSTAPSWFKSPCANNAFWVFP